MDAALSHRSSNVSLVAAFEADFICIENLMQFYNYDISEWIPISLNAQGRITVRSKLHYLSAATTHPFLVYDNQELAGFAIVDHDVHLPDAEYNLGYLFISRRFRGQGIGKIVVEELFDRFPGRWQIWHYRKNQGAAKYWSNVAPLLGLSAAPGRDFTIDEMPVDLYEVQSVAN